jgi:putative oxidoreductase
LFLRVVLGGLFVAHGTQKLFGWFGGNGPDATGEFFERQGLRPGRLHATAAGITEAGSGALLLAGLEIPLAAAGITGSMLTAMKAVHLKNGPWATNGGYEYNLVLIAAVLAATEVGPGPLSLEGLREHEHTGTLWALAALAGGSAGALAVHLWSLRDTTALRRDGEIPQERSSAPRPGQSHETRAPEPALEPVATG